jgi:hypothetical protein
MKDEAVARHGEAGAERGVVRVDLGDDIALGIGGREHDRVAIRRDLARPAGRGDILSYVLWPYDYYYPFWSYGTYQGYSYGGYAPAYDYSYGYGYGSGGLL